MRKEKNPVSKHLIQPLLDTERVDAGRDGQARLARPNYHARTETGQKLFSLFS